ncbi:PLP-dependent aminotransferase family protein [Azospirillum sp. YIM B02556]|uniref:PLP-dependent aminotransferase family protein n=1 Tax=Azospirillum endophyticum TaxID=2800326 RepID=A0ABS1FA58_9PROT|nr:PLP-dependent aminotransferase family protein [Azospirillum endophyticum]MBK1840313.1 PLP-dependent aminotransferase family protein [Azospirillum endophyticum]
MQTLQGQSLSPVGRPHPWHAVIHGSDKPRYVAIADVIADDMLNGRLPPGARLPAQRVLAEALEVDFTTVARGYQEAQRRGLIESRVGAGTFVRDGAGAAPCAPEALPTADAIIPAAQPPARSTARCSADLSMNLPPDIDDPELLARMRAGLAEVGQDLVDLLRYQEFGGAEQDRQAGVDWLALRGLPVRAERLLVCAGTHSALHAVLGALAKPGDRICAEDLTYPGLRGLAAQLGLEVVGLPMDQDGILPDAFAEVCRTRPPKALYCNPTLQNPTTVTLSAERRQALVNIARQYGVAIVEDDAYGALPVGGPVPMAALAPDLVFYIGGLAKVLGAGLRVAYLVVPEARHVWQLSAFLRATTVMASPLTVALATRWIGDGTAQAILAAIRAESTLRQTIARGTLPGPAPRSRPEAFHYWLPLPAGWSRSSFAATLRGAKLGIVVSDAFSVNSPAPEAVRLCLGGCDRDETRGALDMIAHTLSRPPELASVFL